MNTEAASSMQAGCVFRSGDKYLRHYIDTVWGGRQHVWSLGSLVHATIFAMSLGDNLVGIDRTRALEALTRQYATTKFTPVYVLRTVTTTVTPRPDGRLLSVKGIPTNV